MVSSTLCPAVHILCSQNVYGRAEGIADHYWPWAVFFSPFSPFSFIFLLLPLVGPGTPGQGPIRFFAAYNHSLKDVLLPIKNAYLDYGKTDVDFVFELI